MAKKAKKKPHRASPAAVLIALQQQAVLKFNRMDRVILYSSPRFAEHVPPPGHPERPERADVFDVIADEWRKSGGQVIEPRPATRDELARVHAGAYLDAIEATAGRAAMLDADT